MRVLAGGVPFDENYYEHGESLGISLYSNYRWLPDLTFPLSHAIVVDLGIGRGDTILDFGCAKGFLVRALRLLHYEAFGYDISEYAIASAPEDVRPYLNCGEWYLNRYNWLIAKDVLEHISHEDLSATLMLIAGAARRVFVIVPLGDGVKYNAPEYDKDKTHIIREDLAWWSKKFEAAGLSVVSASTEMPRVKPSRCENSDAFFVLESREF